MNRVRSIRNDDVVQRESRRFVASKTCQKHPLSVLRHPTPGVDDLIVHLIAQFVQGMEDDPHRVAFVVRKQVLHVFHKEDLRIVVSKDPHHVEEKRALGLVRKSLRPAN